MLKDLLHIFYPNSYELKDGTKVKEKFNYTPYLVILFAVLILLCTRITGFHISEFFSRFSKFMEMILRMIPPKWSFWDKVRHPLMVTITMSLLGTIFGCALALPVSFYLGNNFKFPKVYLSMHKGVLSILRTLPSIVYAQLISIIVGAGTLAGTISLSIFTFTICVKMMYEQIDTVDMGPYEALESTGASKLRCIIKSIFPQVKGYYLSTVLYCFETNIRSAAILGYVGAGGIGTQISTQLGWRNYGNVGIILLSLVILVVVIEAVSRYFRRRLADG